MLWPLDAKSRLTRKDPDDWEIVKAKGEAAQEFSCLFSYKAVLAGPGDISHGSFHIGNQQLRMAGMTKGIKY